MLLLLLLCIHAIITMVVSRHNGRVLHHVGGRAPSSVDDSRVLFSLLVAWGIDNRDHTVTISIVAVIV